MATSQQSYEGVSPEAERRHKREEYRRGGGSHRRTIKSFRTEDEKRAMRRELSETLTASLDTMSDAVGMLAFARAAQVNPHLTAGNVALVAYFADHRDPEIVGPIQFWKRAGYSIRKGERAELRLIGSGFWPAAAFSESQTSAAGESAQWMESIPDVPEDLIQACLSAHLSAPKPIEGARLALDRVKAWEAAQSL